jgi:8-oxo-dGTP pyrophosphatase MutT (NUDIX family)
MARNRTLAANRAIGTAPGGRPPSGSASPLAQELAAGMGVPVQNTADWGNAYGGFGLPRPASTFTDGAFGPFPPIQSVPVDSAEPGEASPDPRREEYRVGWNLPVGQPGTEGLKLADFNTLRTIADLYSVARACITFIKAQITSLEWDIMPTPEAAKAMRNNDAEMKDFGKRRAEAVKFLRRPDPDYDDWQSWAADVLEEILVYDALSIVVREKRGKGLGKGVLGSDLDCLQLISGPTIRPLYDLEGGRPRPPAVAFQQYLYGVPRVDMWTMVTERDLDESGLKGSEMRAYGGQQLMYLRTQPRRWTPYGFPPVERGLVPIMSGLQKQAYQLDYFREGTIPGIFVSPGGNGAEMTPNQIRELQDALNAIAGDPAWKHKVVVLPAGSRVDPMRPPAIADAFDEIVMMQTCMAFGIQPMQIGIMPKVSSTSSPGAENQMAKQAASANDRDTVAPLVIFLTNILNRVLQEICGQTDMRVMFEGMQEEEDEETTTNLLVNQISHGLLTIDEGRDVLGKQPFNIPETSDPGWATQTGYVPLNAAALMNTMGPGAPAGVLAAGAGGNAAAGPPSKTPPGPPAPPAAPGAQGAKPTAPGGKPSSGGAKPGSTAAGNAGQSPGHAAAEAGAQAARTSSSNQSAGASGGGSPSAGSSGSSTAKPKAKPATKADKDAKHLAARTAAVAASKDKVSQQLYDLALRHRDKDISTADATHEGKQILQDAYSDILQTAAADAEDQGLADAGGYSMVDFVSIAATRAATQATYLMWMLAAAGSAASDALGWLQARTDLYAQSLQGTYNQGFGLAVGASNPEYTITWHLGDAEHCELCVARDGKTYTFKQLPGWPGDGGFGGKDAICLGGQNCKCYLSYSEGGTTLAQTTTTLDRAGYFQQQLSDITARRMQAQEARESFVASLPNDFGEDDTSAQSRAMNRDELRQQLADLANQRIRSLGGYPGVAVEPGDIPASMIAQFLPQYGPQNMAGLSLTDLMDAVSSMWPKFAHVDITKGNFEAAVLGAVSDMRERQLHFSDTAYRQAKASQLIEVEIKGSPVMSDGDIAKFADRLGDRIRSDRMFHVEPYKVVAEAEACVRRLDKGGSWSPKLLDDDSVEYLRSQLLSSGNRSEAVSRFKEWFESRAARRKSAIPTRDYAVEDGERWVDTGGQVHVPEDEEGLEPPVVSDNPYDPAGFGGPVQRPHDADDIFHAEPVGDGTRPMPVHHREQGKAAADHGDPNPVEAEHVYSQMLINYPPKSIKWIKKVRWIGPVLVPTDRVDTDDEHSWAASHQQTRVEHFADKLRKGKPVHPGVSVQEPGENKIKVIDGHHRYEAAVKAGKPFLTYVGFVDTDGGVWDETHSSQFHSGASPQNKGDGPVAAGIALQAQDTGRVLMLQRALKDDDPAGGRWEFPGGRLEPGESALEAARREWQEETGITLPDTVTALGAWESDDGVYNGFALAVPHETDIDIHGDRDAVVNPDDPDGDFTESLAWWNPEEISGCPVMRDQVRAHAAETLHALKPTGNKLWQASVLAKALGEYAMADYLSAASEAAESGYTADALGNLEGAERAWKGALSGNGWPQSLFTSLVTSLGAMLQNTVGQLRGLTSAFAPSNGSSLPTALGFQPGPNLAGWPTL